MVPALLALALLAAETAQAEESPWSSGGEVGLEGRAFLDDGDPRTEDQALGMLGRLELGHRRQWLEGKLRTVGRLDAFDRERSWLIAEEAWVQAVGRRLRLRLGADIVNWSATEAFHPADVINARNLDGDIEAFEKIGEPMAALQVRASGSTTLDLLLMPVFMTSRFPSPRSRLSFAPPGVDLRGRERLIDRHGNVTDGAFGPQAAVNVRQILGSADLTVHLLEHMDRLQPWVGFDATSGEPALVYQTVRQLGGTFQQVFGPAVAKIESAYRWFLRPNDATTTTVGPIPDRDHAAVAAGLEYGHDHASGALSTFILEAQTIVGPARAIRRTLDPFQADVFAGTRFAWNDASSRELLIFGIVDLEIPGEFLVAASYEQRLGDRWTLNLGVRIFQAKPASPLETRGLSLVRAGDHLHAHLTRHF